MSLHDGSSKTHHKEKCLAVAKPQQPLRKSPWQKRETTPEKQVPNIKRDCLRETGFLC